MPPVEETQFYAEVAKKGRKHWDHEKILPAKHELMELYRAPDNKMIGDEQVCVVSALRAPTCEALCLPPCFLISSARHQHDGESLVVIY